MLILAIDPGQTTGVCALESDPENNIRVVAAVQIPWSRRIEDFAALLAGTSEEGLQQPDVIVFEAFRLRPGRAMEQVGSIFPSVRVIGIVEALHYTMDLKCPIVYQEPSILSRTEVLEEHKQHFVGREHAADAYRHARYYHVTRKQNGNTR